MAWTQPEKSENTFDVMIIGAGISGINFAYRLQERCPELSYAILENRHEIGGTWSLFNYPGIRSDSDLYTFGFRWRPWPHKTAIAQGPLVKGYMQEAAADAGIDKHIRFHHHVDTADWSSSERMWKFDVTANQTEQKTFKARWMMQCTGYYDYEKPLKAVIPGIDNFQGTVIHPQFWPDNLDYANKDVVIVGSGATAITILPNMAEKASHVTMLQRSPSYVLPISQEDPLDKALRRWFSWSPTLTNLLIRWKFIFLPMMLCYYTAHFPAHAKKAFLALIAKQLPTTVPADPHFTPKYNVWDQRLCMTPDGDFFKALRSDRASVVTDTIADVTATTIRLASGATLTPDIIITATGLQLRFGGGVTTRVDGVLYDPPQHFAWKGVMLEDLPNAAFVVGYVDASWTLAADATALLVTRLLRRMRAERVAVVTPRMEPGEREHVREAKMLRLSSTYLQRAAEFVPKVAVKGQWRARKFYIFDLLSAMYGDIKTNAEWVKA